MKNIKPFLIKKHVLIGIVLLIITSCDNYLNLQPTDGLISDEYWTKKEDVRSVLGAAYEKFADLDHTLFVHGEVRGDMITYARNTPANQLNMMRSNIESNNSFAKWSGFYVVINLCNHVIDFTPQVQDQDVTFNDYQAQQYISEAIFLRSLCYFYLVRIFNDVPYVTVPTESDNAEFFTTTSPAADVLAYIKDDLINIRQKTPQSYPSLEATKSRATAAAVNSLLADISLWNEDYDDCISYIDAVENSGKYFLTPSLEWFTNFYTGLSLESIFEIYFDANNNQSNSLYTNTYQRHYYIISPYGEEILNNDELLANEAIRSTGSYFASSLKCSKYAMTNNETVRSGTDQSSANWIIYRLADLYLMKAEAYSQKSSPEYGKALEYLNLVHERAGFTALSVAENARAFEDAILEERAKEFAFEGKRWFDLLRMGKRNNYARKDELIEVLVQNVASSQRLVLAAKLSNPLGWYMPIHINEINRNSKLKQNPYYDDEK